MRHQFIYFLLTFFVIILAVMYDKKFILNLIRRSIRSQIYHIVKDVASLITTSSENDVFLAGHTFETRRLNTAELGQLRDIVNITKIHRQYSWDVRRWCSDKKEGIFLSVSPFKEKKSTSDPSCRLSAGRFYGQSQWNLCHGCPKLHEHYKICTDRVHYISFKWRKII